MEKDYKDPCLHFVGFMFKDERWWSAVKVFGPPDFVHGWWDNRAKREIGPHDVVVFADGDDMQSVRKHNAEDIVNLGPRYAPRTQGRNRKVY